MYRDELETLTNREWELSRQRLRMTVRRAYVAWLERQTRLEKPRVVLIEDLENGTKRITFRSGRRKPKP